MKKILPIVLVIMVVVGGGAFYGGMKYAQSKSLSRSGQGNFQNFQNLSPEERQQRLQQVGAAGVGLGGKRSEGSNFASGDIIAKDDKSLTIKLQDGGSKIIFYSDTTEVNKFVSGAPSDLEVGKTVTVNGEANQDGSVTAQTIQLRPAITPAP